MLNVRRPAHIPFKVHKFAYRPLLVATTLARVFVRRALPALPLRLRGSGTKLRQ